MLRRSALPVATIAPRPGRPAGIDDLFAAEPAILAVAAMLIVTPGESIQSGDIDIYAADARASDDKPSGLRILAAEEALDDPRTARLVAEMAMRPATFLLRPGLAALGRQAGGFPARVGLLWLRSAAILFSADRLTLLENALGAANGMDMPPGGHDIDTDARPLMVALQPSVSSAHAAIAARRQLRSELAALNRVLGFLFPTIGRWLPISCLADDSLENLPPQAA